MAISAAFPSPSKKPLNDEMKDIKRLLDELSEMNLTNWEDDFVSSLLGRIEQFEGGTIISDQQGHWLNKLATKYDLDPA